MNISQNDLQNHIKKNSCVLYSNDIRKMYYKLKEKTYSQNYNNINIKRKDQNLTSRQNNSLNSKKIVNTKAYFFSRPYSKQLSQYSFLTSKKKNSKDNCSIPRLNESKDFEKNEKDDKTNIYFNLIKTYYDENGIKLKPKKKEIYPIDNENNYFKKIKAKKKKKNNNINIDKNEENKIMHTNRTLFFPEIKKKENNHKDKLNITYRKIIKIDNNSFIKKKTSSSSECNYNKKVKDLITSPSKSEKSFNIFFQNKSGDYIINDIKKNPLITNDNDNLNNDNTSSLSVIANNSNIPFPKNKEKKKNLSNIIAYFNKRVNDLKFIPAKKISEIILSPQFNSSSYNSLNNQIQNRRHNTCIFHKKKISDLFANDKHNIKNLKAIKKKPSLELSHVASFRYPKRKLNKQHNNSGKIIKQHIINLSLNTINNNNNNYNINTTNTKISPKRLEKYFNPNQTSKEDLSYKFNYLKNPTETENIDINNVTFKKPFNNVKNIKLRNNSNKGLNKKNKTDVNYKNSKNVIPSSNKNKNINNEIINNLSHNMSFNNDKQIESILINNNSNIMKYYRIKNMIKKYKEIPFNRKKEKITQNKNINPLKGEITINNKCDENIININQKKYIIRYYNCKNNDINIIKEKLKKYVLLNNTKKDSRSKKYNVNNQKLLSEIDIKNNMINRFISPRNNQSNISINISHLNQ